MGLFATSNADLLTARLRELRKRINGQCAAEVLKYNAYAVLKGTIALDDKLAVLNSKKGTTAANVREAAVARSIKRTMSPLTKDDFSRSVRMKAALSKAAEKGDLAELSNLMARFKTSGARYLTAVHFSAQHHKSALRPATGRTALTYKRVVLPDDKAKLASYVEAKKAHAGYKFAGFIPALRALGAKSIPKIISRHKSAAGWVKLDLDGPSQQVQVCNQSSYDRKLKDRVRASMAVRERALGTAIKRLAKGEATNLGFAVFTGGPEGRIMTLAEFKAMRAAETAKRLSD